MVGVGVVFFWLCQGSCGCNSCIVLVGVLLLLGRKGCHVQMPKVWQLCVCGSNYSPVAVVHCCLCC